MNYADLPVITYRGKPAPNLMNKIKLTPEYLQARSVFHPYVIKEHDRPDTLAFYYYGSSYYDWLILLANDIYDIKTQWPLTQYQLDKTIEAQYGSINNALSTISHYVVNTNVLEISKQQYETSVATAIKKYWVYNEKLDNYQIVQQPLILSVEAYANLSSIEKTMWSPVSVYNNEMLKNERKRSIVLIDTSYSQTMKQLAESLVNE